MEEGSDKEYLPGEDSENSDTDADMDDSDDEETLLQYEPVSLPIMDDGWHFMSDPFTDARPDPLPNFNGAIIGQFSENVPQFTCPTKQHFLGEC